MEYFWYNRQIKLRAEIPNTEFFYNRPDVVMNLTNTDEIIVLEILEVHLQNIHLQEKIKRLKYSKNSTYHVRNKNVDDTPRSHNLVGAFARMYKCPVQLEIMIFGALGEVADTPEIINIMKILNS